VIEKFFKNLSEIVGIEAIALLDNNNHIIDTWIESKYDTSIFTEIGLSYLQIFSIQENRNFDINEIVLLFDKGLLFVRNHQKFVMIVIANPNIDISLIRLAINVGIFELGEARKIQKQLKKFPADKSHSINELELDDAEHLMIEKIAENKDGSGTSE
jgi:hypothetical protein